jgi:hypothetical protein
MGTATQSISNQAQRDEFDNLLKEAIKDPIEKDSIEREIQLGRVFRDIVSKVIATDPALAGVKPTLDAAINKVVKPAIETKLRDWIASGKKKADWPFKHIKITPR